MGIFDTYLVNMGAKSWGNIGQSKEIAIMEARPPNTPHNGLEMEKSDIMIYKDRGVGLRVFPQRPKFDGAMGRSKDRII